MMVSFPSEKSLATHGQNALEKFQAAYTTLEGIESTIPGQPDAAMPRSQMQRFQLWATNLGLYRHDHGSLDYRLRDNEVAKSFTRELLINLNESLEESVSSYIYVEQILIESQSELCPALRIKIRRRCLRKCRVQMH